MSAARSTRAEVRNPILGLPAAREALAALPIDQAEALRTVLLQIQAQAKEKERESYAKRKGPMTSYWMAVGTYCKHIAHAIRATERQGAIL